MMLLCQFLISRLVVGSFSYPMYSTNCTNRVLVPSLYLVHKYKYVPVAAPITSSLVRLEYRIYGIFRK